MKRLEIEPVRGLKMVARTRRGAAVTMVVEPGRRMGGRENRLEGSDQWLYVLAGTGTATVEGRHLTLRAATLVIIEAGEAYELVNTGEDPLRTLSFYAPPYD